jgi:hypothetical protein
MYIIEEKLPIVAQHILPVSTEGQYPMLLHVLVKSFQIEDVDLCIQGLAAQADDLQNRVIVALLIALHQPIRIIDLAPDTRGRDVYGGGDYEMLHQL